MWPILPSLIIEVKINFTYVNKNNLWSDHHGSDPKLPLWRCLLSFLVKTINNTFFGSSLQNIRETDRRVCGTDSINPRSYFSPIQARYHSPMIWECSSLSLQTAFCWHGLHCTMCCLGSTMSLFICKYSHRFLVLGMMLVPKSGCFVPGSFENETLLICL